MENPYKKSEEVRTPYILKDSSNDINNVNKNLISDNNINNEEKGYTNEPESKQIKGNNQGNMMENPY